MFNVCTPASTFRFTSLARATKLATTAATCAALLTPVALRAQVGHKPTNSPYEDVKVGQTLSINGGWLVTGKDPAGVAAQSSPFAQLRYDVAVGGPAFLFARYSYAPSQRSLLVPSNVATKREIGTPSVSTNIMDVGLDVALTGRKTWRHLMPSVMGSFGLVSDFQGVDTSSYKFGTKFTLSYGLGVRYVRPTGFQLRFDLSNYLWSYQYPDTYFIKASDSTAVLTNTKDRSKWKSNWAFTAGVALPIFR